MLSIEIIVPFHEGKWHLKEFSQVFLAAQKGRHKKAEVGLLEFESRTPRSSAVCSPRLSYKPIWCHWFWGLFKWFSPVLNKTAMALIHGY
jgi:hypothetical protein